MDLLTCPRDASFRDQRIQRYQEIEIEPAEMHYVFAQRRSGS
jgi:hypothetical protein